MGIQSGSTHVCRLVCAALEEEQTFSSGLQNLEGPGEISSRGKGSSTASTITRFGVGGDSDGGDVTPCPTPGSANSDLIS